MAVVVVLGVGGLIDTAANWGKAYGNVTINGIDVGGLTSEQIQEKLQSSLSQSVSQTHVKVFASEEAQAAEDTSMTEEERLAHLAQVAQAEEVSVEEADAVVTSWATDAQSLKASIPYERLANEALEYGRDQGGLLSRLGLFFGVHDITVLLDYDAAALDGLAAQIDRTIGDARIDATVAIEDGIARAVEGHDGMMVDRTWFAEQLSAALVSGQPTSSFVAKVSSAPSRITMEQATQTSDNVNHALQVGAVFSYDGKDWAASANDIGQWTRVETVEDGNGSYKLGVHIDQNAAIPAVVSGAGAVVRSEDVTVKFAKGDNGIVVRTFGPGNIPEVTPAVEQLNEDLYGENGVAWDLSAAQSPKITIEESDAPAALTLDQAIDSGIVTVIGEYTTEFTNYEGTENRNHNIKLAADILNYGIIDANGGVWSFNDRSGDTNEAAGFWAAGSIVQGEVVDSIGGGICQIATTIFNAVYEAGLHVDLRYNHQLYIASYPTGRDATVDYPDLDLQWTNNLSSDILLVMSYTDTTVTARLYSVRTGYRVESEEGDWQDGAKYKTVYKEDPTLSAGQYYTETAGSDGSSISVTRYVYNEAGEKIDETTFYSRYDAKDEVVMVGPGTDTKKLEEAANGEKGTEEGQDESGRHQGAGEGASSEEEYYE